MYTESDRRRWVFSSSLLPNADFDFAKQVFCGLFQLLLPDDCRVCGEPLREISRIPVCSRCLKDPAPLVADYFCASCRTPFLNRFPLDESGQCGLCRLGLNGFDAVFSYGSYEGSLRTLIHLFKYGGVQPLARVFGDLLAVALPRELRFDLIVPMPLHWTRRWQRRYNQAELLAREVSRRWNVPVENAVRRRRATVPQAGLSNAQRRDNVSGVFAVKTRLTGRQVLLVDDVLTTGASASACARALKRAGAARVTVLALARTDRRAQIFYSAEARGPLLEMSQTAAAGSSAT
jgi:ComF family protein